MPTPLFVYGSLMSPRVLQTVLGRPHPHTQPGVALGFHRYQINNRSYPALCRSSRDDKQQEPVRGVLVRELSERDIGVLDEFEGPEYTRTPIKVQLDDGTETEAFTYLWTAGDTDPDLYGDWSFERDFLPREEDTLKEWSLLGLFDSRS